MSDICRLDIRRLSRLAAPGALSWLLLEGLLYGELHKQVATGHYGGVPRTEILHRHGTLFFTEDGQIEQLHRDEWTQIIVGV